MDDAQTLYERLSVAGAAATGHRRSLNLDVLRATAALMVLVAHAYFLGAGAAAHPDHRLGIVIACFSSGVWLFFAISGYLIAGPFITALLRARPLPASSRYAVRRAARILPAYWLALAVALLLITGSRLVHWWELPLHGLLAQDLVPDEPNRFLFVAWTLSVEAMFYLFVPLAAWFVYRLRGSRALDVAQLAKLVIGLWALSLAWRLGVSLIDTPARLAAGDLPATLSALRWVLPAFLYAFAPGMLIFLAETPEAAGRGGAWALYRRLRSRPLLVAGAALLLLVAVVELGQRGGRWTDLDGTLVAIPAGLGLVAALGVKRLPRPVVGIAAPLGLVSYGIYLWHAVVRDALLKHAPGIVPGSGLRAWPAALALLLAATVPLAAASWLLVERPLLRWTTNWDRRRATATEPVQPEAPLPAPHAA